MSRAGNVWDNSAMESFFSSLKTERTNRKVYRTRDEARADVFDYIERFYNPRRRHSKLGYLSPMEFEARAMLYSDSLKAGKIACHAGVLGFYGENDSPRLSMSC